MPNIKKCLVSGSCSLIHFAIEEGPEGVKWELGLACFCPGKMGFRSLGLGFGRWEWDKKMSNMGMG